MSAFIAFEYFFEKNYFFEYFFENFFETFGMIKPLWVGDWDRDIDEDDIDVGERLC